MIQIDRTPMSRGVTQLMYVGDDDAVEKAVSPSRAAWAVAALAGGLALAATNKSTRRVAGAVAVIAALRAITR